MIGLIAYVWLASVPPDVSTSTQSVQAVAPVGDCLECQQDRCKPCDPLLVTREDGVGKKPD